jgi:hypothetical protein
MDEHDGREKIDSGAQYKQLVAPELTEAFSGFSIPAHTNIMQQLFLSLLIISYE